MLRKARRMGRSWIAALVAVAIVLAAVMLYISAGGVERAAVSGLLPEGGHGARLPYYGPRTLEERILGSDVIARVRLTSTDQVVEELAYSNGETMYAKALEFNFRVLEYLQGSGGSELAAVAPDLGATYGTRQGATGGPDLLAGRDTRWDGREAIVFLSVDHPSLPRIAQAARYWFGPLRLVGEEYYTITSERAKRWLPSASSGGARGSGGDEQRFLLDVPQSGGEAASVRSAQSGGAATITLGKMKARISEIDREIAAGGGSQAFRDCLYYKYEWEREVRYRKDSLGGVYHRIREDEALASGLPAETRAYRSIDAGLALQEYGPTPPDGNWGEFRVVGRDEDLFAPQWPGVAVTARPLPAGTYQFHWAYRPPEYILCDAHPEDELKRHEVFITVTAPAGTLHEALFDPAAIGTAVGADAANGVVEPAGFTVGGTATTLQALKWESGVVTMELSPAASLSGYDMDVIELDGSTSLTLSVAGATSNAGGTLTWAVTDQPWHAGDQLMLRIRTAGPPPPTATPTLAPTATPESTATPEPTATPTPTPTPEPTATPDPDAAPVTVTLRPRPLEGTNLNNVNMTVEWTDPGACNGRYFVAVYMDESLDRSATNLGFYPAPATTSVYDETDWLFEYPPADDWWVGVSCAPNDGNRTLVGKAHLHFVLPSDSDGG